MAIKDVTTDEFQEIISEGTVLVDLWAPWCGPCKMVGSILKEIDSKSHDFDIVKVDVDQEQEIAKQFNVSSIPTLLVFKDGELVSRTSGFLPEEAILDLVK